MSSPLEEGDRARLFEGDDAAFYDQPRFVHHVDDAFRERLTARYREVLAEDDAVLDLTSSWVSHLPPERDLGRVVGHGMNEAELRRNEALDDWFVQNLNEDQSLPLADDAFDAVLCAVSVQYLQYPVPVFSEVARVLRTGGVVVVSFSNRMFPQKAIRAWRTRSMDDRAALVAAYLRAAGGFTEPTIRSTVDSETDPFYAVVAGRE